MTILAAVPGQPTRWLSAPAGEADAAIARIRALAARFAAERVFGFLDPPAIEAHLNTLAPDTITTSCRHWREWPDSPQHPIDWRWGVLWDSGDWYEPGWHPDRNWQVIHGREVNHLCWQALNAGKRRPR